MPEIAKYKVLLGINTGDHGLKTENGDVPRGQTLPAGAVVFLDPGSVRTKKWLSMGAIEPFEVAPAKKPETNPAETLSPRVRRPVGPRPSGQRPVGRPKKGGK